MRNKEPLFILGGNGSYNNRGCEAIVRGTVNIIKKHYESPSFLCVTQYTRDELFRERQFTKQVQEETDKTITHKKTVTCKNIFDGEWVANRIFRKIAPNTDIYDHIYKEMIPHIPSSKAVLSIGGDNYAIDFGLPKMVLKLDEIVLKRGKPLIIWGASVGPFNKVPKYEKYMTDHLQKVTAIFARESATVEYLEKIGVTENVYKVADPAFLMEAKKPENGLEIKEGSIGLNFSPLMAKYITNGDINKWTKEAAEIVLSVSKNTLKPIYLIPHVTVPNSDDYIFMKNMITYMNKTKEEIFLVPPNYNAAEIKWVISKMHVFAGSRTHSTIAALSSKVPTLSFAYSMKAKALTKIF